MYCYSLTALSNHVFGKNKLWWPNCKPTRSNSLVSIYQPKNQVIFSSGIGEGQNRAKTRVNIGLTFTRCTETQPQVSANVQVSTLSIPACCTAPLLEESHAGLCREGLDYTNYGNAANHKAQLHVFFFNISVIIEKTYSRAYMLNTCLKQVQRHGKGRLLIVITTIIKYNCAYLN